MKKIGILGGTFDPIHNIHIEIAKAAMKQYHLSEMIVVPVKIPPHKPGIKISKDEDRIQMAKLACRDLEHFFVSDYEIKKSGISYTSETLSYFSELYPDAELYFVVGGDSITYMETWNRPEVIFEKAHILYAVRDGDGRKKVANHIKNVLNILYLQPRISEVKFRETSVSSTSIRAAISNGEIESIKEDVSPLVLDYILKKGLYSQ